MSNASPPSPSSSPSSSSTNDYFEDARSTISDEHGQAEEIDVSTLLEQAAERKEEANELFRNGKWAEALNTYAVALAVLPRRAVKSKAKDASGSKDEIDRDSEPIGEGEIEELVSPLANVRKIASVEEECAKARSILNANMGACHVKLGEHKQAVELCTEALKDNPVYLKALQRRAESNESIGSWSALTSAIEDYETLIRETPKPSPLTNGYQRKIQLLKPRAEATQKREMDEMLGKLKELGNGLLGRFGLSTDNFKFEPNGQGGYSMNFSQ